MAVTFRQERARARRVVALAAVLGVAGCKLALELDRYAFLGAQDAGASVGPLSPRDGGASAPANPDAAATCASCAAPHAEARCQAGECAIVQCVGPWRDVNGVASDGCETGDVPAQGLALWFMADRGVTEDEGRVSSWIDQSPNRYLAAQGVTAQMPSLVERAGQQMLSFDGSDDALTLPAGFTSLDGTAFFAVVEAQPNELCAGILHFSNGPDVDDVEFGRHRPNLLYYEVLDLFVEGAPQAFRAGPRFVVSTLQADADLTTGSPGAEAGAVELRIDGVLTGAGVIPLPRAIQRAQNYVGRNAYTLNRDVCTMHFRGAIGELIFYPRELRPAEREQIERYLNEKWLSAAP